MQELTEREVYIALNTMDRVGPVAVRRLAEALGGVAAIWGAGEAALRAVPGVGPALATALVTQRPVCDLAGELGRAQERGVRVITPADADYPPALAAIHDPPLALYVRGTLQSRDAHAVAVVGTRRPTHYGRDTARRLAAGLAHAGFTVVSGLARGIDTAAHESALEARGRTLAVLGSGFDHLYPPANAGLAERIAERGAVISEFPMGRRPDKTTFPMRNRIVSGLSRGVVVVEAGARSGALITATAALEQGRDVFAVPGRIDTAAAQGCHDLIRSGAVLVRGTGDVLDVYGELWRGATRSAAGSGPAPVLGADEQALVDLLQAGDRGVDELIRETALGAGAVNAALVGLEMKHVTRMLPGRRVALRAEGACVHG